MSMDLRATAGLTHEEAMALQATELEATLALLRTLGEHDWTVRVPDCPAWDIRQMYLHVLGACEGAAFPEMVRQMAGALRRQRRTGGPLEANLFAVQVARRETLSPTGLVDRLTAPSGNAVASPR